ncbi:uncharacterized protein LOC141600927 [Silene latifolia]|uniref:uncharacterized protein LOC141600927 n=1 Tax=Silene latifolia TaxID=37657 RepID=UPI003D783EDF
MSLSSAILRLVREAALSDQDFGLNEFDLGLNIFDYFINNQEKEGDSVLKGVEAGLGVEGKKANKEAGECSKANEKVLFGVDDLDVNVSSDVDYDSDELRSLQKGKKLSKGLKFPSVEIFRKALIHHSVKNGYDFWYSHNGRDRVTAQCYNRCNCEWNKKRSKLGKSVCEVDNPCRFYVYARKLRDQETFQIKGLRLKHKCVMSNYNRKIGSEFLADKYLEFWRTNLDGNIKRFHNHVRVHVSYMRCWLARSRVKLVIHGNGNDQYARFSFLDCDNIDRPPLIFKRFYTCLKACKEGFKIGCRPILGIDGCHLKGVYPGMCLVAVELDGNNNIYPVAWAVVEVENRDSWTWFLELLSHDIEKVDEEGLTVMSDRHKGLVEALDNVVPKANIRFCARHIWATFKLRWSGQLFKETFWAAARALTMAYLKREMKGIEFLSKDAHDYLIDIPLQHWSRHTFDVNCKSNLLLNNLCEVFNAVLKEARDKSILTPLEWMRRYDEASFATFMQSDDGEFGVELKGEQFFVNLKTRSCGCRWFVCILQQFVCSDELWQQLPFKQ